MYAYMSALLSGSADPFWPHLVLISGSVLAGIAVGVGIIMESERWSLATILVVMGVGVEAVFTLCLFVFDERISGSQQDKIIALETQLAPRELRPTQQDLIVQAAKPVASGIHVKFFTYAFDPDGRRLGVQLSDVFTRSGFTVVGIDSELEKLAPKRLIVGIELWTSGKTIEVRDALISLLNKEGISAAADPEPIDGEGWIVVLVGLKPPSK
jgi:hypothetical protein